MSTRIERIEGRFVLIIYFLEGLRKDFEDAIEGYHEGSQYKGDYLREKHGDENEIARLRIRLRQLDEILAQVKELQGANSELRIHERLVQSDSIQSMERDSSEDSPKDVS